MSGGLAAIIFGFLMRRSSYFRQRTVITMIGSGVGALFVLVPAVGVIMLFFLVTTGGVLASIFTGADLLRLSKQSIQYTSSSD